jgi:hypothetical protein
MNRPSYITLWVFEILAVVGLVLALSLPIQDYALREYLDYQRNPTADTYKAFLEKERQEQPLQFLIAIPLIPHTLQ